jgi:predicted O-methyltransferase YrrM
MTAPNEAYEPAKEGISQLFTRRAVRSFLRQPRFFVANLRQGPQWMLDKRREVSVDVFKDHWVSEAEAVCAVTGASADDYRRVRPEIWRPAADPNEPLAVWNAREELQNVVGGLIKLLRPAVMVETGVALGYTSAVALTAMRDNGTGSLYSIDLPAIQYDPDQEVGRVVPHDVRDRWQLELGTSKQLLAPMLQRLGSIDIFLHDANHAYSSQLWEYRTAWPALRSGGVLVSDDVGNTAFTEFAAEVGQTPYIVPSESRASAIGLMRKP